MLHRTWRRSAAPILLAAAASLALAASASAATTGD
jgi:hypothetical protein